MRALFWRRKNARLATRLNTLVETSERARKTRRRKPSRVVIDTSYLEQEEAQAVLQTEHAPENVPENLNDATYPADGHGATSPDGRSAAAAAETVSQDIETDHYSDYAEHGHEDDADEASALLREAVEQLDLAEAGQAEALEREAEALKEVELQRLRVEELEAGLASAQQARDLAEQALQTEKSKPDASASQPSSSLDVDVELRQELETHRTMVAELSADLRREQKSHAQAVADRDAATGLVAAAELKLSGLRETEAEYEEFKTRAAAADARAAVAAKNAESSRVRSAQLEAELGQAQTERQTAEEAKATAEMVAEELKGQIETLEQAAVDAASLEKRATEAESNAADARATLVEAQAETQALTEKVAEGERVHAELGDVREQLAAAKREVEDSAVREASVQAELQTQNTAAKNLEDELEAARKALSDAETAHAKRITELDSEIAELRKAAAQHATELEERVGPLREEAETQRDAASQLAVELKNLRETLADVEADKEALTARASASERRLVEAQSLAAQVEASLRTDLDAVRAELEAIGNTTETDAAEGGFGTGDLQRSAAGDLARTAQIENERDVLRRQLAEVQRSAEAAAERETDKDQELAELRQALAEREAIREDHADDQQREMEALQELEVERQRVADIAAELEQERAARAAAETRLNETLKQTSDDGADDFAVGGTVELEPAAAEESETAPSKVSELVTLPTVAEEKPQQPESVVVAKRETPAPKRGNRIASKTERNGVSAAALNITGPASRVDSVIQSRMAKATAKKEAAKENRRAKRVASRKLASLWQEGMSAGLSCTMLDRSSTGAKLEVLTDRFNDRMNEINVGDRFTVTQTYAQERTSVACEVMWVHGQRCGVRFCGQIHTEIQKPAKRALPKQPEKSTASSAIKSLFGAGAR
ncbi:MAG: PilZ domain-containing protein [Hyphomicrobiaceae bacterium]